MGNKFIERLRRFQTSGSSVKSPTPTTLSPLDAKECEQFEKNARERIAAFRLEQERLQTKERPHENLQNQLTWQIKIIRTIQTGWKWLLSAFFALLVSAWGFLFHANYAEAARKYDALADAIETTDADVNDLEVFCTKTPNQANLLENKIGHFGTCLAHVMIAHQWLYTHHYLSTKTYCQVHQFTTQLITLKLKNPQCEFSFLTPSDMIAWANRLIQRINEDEETLQLRSANLNGLWQIEHLAGLHLERSVNQLPVCPQ